MDSRNILITGASGLIGSALDRHLSSQGHQVFALCRGDADAPFHYSMQDSRVRLDSEIRLDAVINLAGANISARRWSAGYKRLIMDSRIELTRALAAALAQAPHKPAVLLSATAIGFYGDTGAANQRRNLPARIGFSGRCRRQLGTSLPAG